MAINLDIATRTGGAMPGKREQADLKRYVNELKMSAASWAQQRLAWQQEGEARARANIEKVIAKARAQGNHRVVTSMLQAMANRSRAEAEALAADLERLQWHIAVDVLSIVDPTPISDGVSIWMDLQEAND